MPTTAGDIMALSAALLNDADQNTYNDDVLFPFLVMAYQELQAECDANGISIIKDILASTDVDSGVVELEAPDDLIAPIALYERVQGSTSEDDWKKMTQKEWEPNTPQSESLVYWIWREGQFKFVGATTDREVRIRYLRDLDALVDDNSNIARVANARLFLQFETAALCSGSILKIEKTTNRLEKKAEYYLALTLVVEVKNNQGFVTTRRPFGTTRKMRSRLLY